VKILGIYGEDARWFEHSLGASCLTTHFLEASIVTEGASIIFELHNNKAVHSTNREPSSFTQTSTTYNYSVVSDSFCLYTAIDLLSAR
jgi:hypothetical protein